MSSQRQSPVMDVALIAVFAALIAVFSLTPAVPLPGIPVPITLQTLAIALTAMIIGPWRGMAATLLYLVLGFVGLPVFAGGASTVAVLAKPSAGYLLAFPFYALVVGLLSQWFVRRGGASRPLLLIAAGLIGSFLVIHPAGIAGLMRNIPTSLSAAVKIDMAFWIGDVIKTVVAALVATAVHKAFPTILARRTPAEAQSAANAR